MERGLAGWRISCRFIIPGAAMRSLVNPKTSYPRKGFKKFAFCELFNNFTNGRNEDTFDKEGND